MSYFLQMALNNAWANATLYGAMRDLPEGAFTAPRPGFFPSLAATMNHIYEVDLYYLDALTQGGRGRAVYDRAMAEHPGQLAPLQAEADLKLAQFCQGLTTQGLSEMRRTERPGAVVEERVDRLLLHLFQHQIHHRGQAHVQLSEAGIAPPQLDEFYLADGRAKTAEPFWK